jgi:hypothetical protein
MSSFKKEDDKKEEKKAEIVERFEKKSKPSKIETIKASKMPEWQKKQLIEQLQGKADDLKGKIPFSVYARVKKLSSGVQKAMLAYPEAKKVSLATVEEWDLIFKNF